MFWVKATHSQRVRFALTPTGTNVGPYAKLLGKDGDPRRVHPGLALPQRAADRPLSVASNGTRWHHQ